MGIPGFFNNCIVKYNVPNDPKRVIRTDLKSMENRSLNNDIINNNPNTSKTKLFLDFNCAIYYVLKPEFKTDETLIIHTIEYLDNLVKIFNNLDLLYIAIDGVPPRAKMEQQRSRRFHSVCKKKKANEINQKYGSELDMTVYNNYIDTNMITPGTVFMNKLTNAIRKHLSESDLYKDKRVIFSDSSIPGEGEHKILSYIKTNEFDDTDEIVIYGLDGDLIMLSMIANRKNMYLLREAVQYGGFARDYNGHKYLFLDIDNLKDAIMDSFNSHCDELQMSKRERFITDYIFLCFILGNDFVPKIHWFSLYEGGHNRLITAYFQIYNHSEDFLIDLDEMKINHIMLMDIFQYLMNYEDKAIKNTLRKRTLFKVPVTKEMTERERQQALSDFLPMMHLHIEQDIDPYSYNWRYRYYKKCFGFNGSKENIDQVTEAYLKTLKWNLEYYFKGCSNWSWYYPYHYAPTAEDIFKVLETTNINKFKFTKDEPIDPQSLLLMVLPYESRNLMCNDIVKNLENNINDILVYFPREYSLNIPFHRYYHECSAKIPRFDYSIVKSFVKRCKFTQDETDRSIINNVFVK
jgi:5'-3' exonuclease